MLWYSVVGLTILLLFIHILVLQVDCSHVWYTITSHHTRLKDAFNVLSVWNVSLLDCAEHCTRRQQCRGINYSEVYKLCELLDYSEGESVVYDDEESKFVHISRLDIVDDQLNDGACSSCLHGVCDPADGICHIKECPKFRLKFGTWRGNRQTVGSKVTLNGCNPNHVLDGDVTSVCQENGTWSSDPSCLWDCGEPRTADYWNTVLEPGTTTNGTVRRYNCVTGFFLSRNRTFTHTDVTCHYGGTWDRGPRCVKDCTEALEASSFFAETRTGIGLQDLDERFYRCPAGLGVLHFLHAPRPLSKFDSVVYNGMITLAPVRRIWCNGLHPAWADVNFKCTRVCTNWPDIKNIGRVTYHVWAGYTMAQVFCEANYSAFRGDTIFHPPAYAEILCNETDTDWQNVDFTCKMDCASHNISDINGDLTYAFQPNLTTVTHACDDGYAMSNGSTLLDITERTGNCESPGGEWQFENWDLTCVKACVNPPNLLNIGDIVYTFSPNETKATYACADDHVISDGRTISTDTEMEITCDIPGGDWNYTNFICLKNCVNPPTGMNIAHVTYTANATHTLAEYACADGHVIYNGNTLTSDTSVIVTCETTGADWKHPVFICAKGCNNPLNDPNIEGVNYTIEVDRTSAVYSCAGGHVILKNSGLTNDVTAMVTCDIAGGEWQNTDFMCVKGFERTLKHCKEEPVPFIIQSPGTCNLYIDINNEHCENAPDMSNMVAWVDYYFTSAKTLVEYTCLDGYAIAEGDTLTSNTKANVTCDVGGGDWHPDIKCVKACGNPPSMNNVASVTFAFSDYATRATYTCDPNHVIAVNWQKQDTDTKTILCTTAGGNWQYADFDCVAVAVNTGDDDDDDDDK